MTRQTNDRNQIWFEKEGQVTKIGFTQEFLNSLDQCWHILPANMERFREKSPLLTVETNDALISILSPVTGSFMNFTTKAQDFPNKLTTNDVVLEVTEGQVRRPEPQALRPNTGAPVRPPRRPVPLAQADAVGGANPNADLWTAIRGAELRDRERLLRQDVQRIQQRIQNQLDEPF